MGSREGHFSFPSKRPGSCVFKRIPPDYIPSFKCVSNVACRSQMATPANSTAEIGLGRVGERGEGGRRAALFRARNSVRIRPDTSSFYSKGTGRSLFALQRMKRRILSFSEDRLRCSFWSLAFAFCLFLRWRLVGFSSLGLKQKSLLRVGCKCQPTSCLLFWLSEEKLKFCSLCLVFLFKCGVRVWNQHKRFQPSVEISVV